MPDTGKKRLRETTPLCEEWDEYNDFLCLGDPMFELMVVDFDRTDIAFADKDNRSLKKGYYLFRLVASPLTVKLGAALLRAALWLRIPVRWAVKPTVFDHFCGGESIADCEKTISTLGLSNIQTILDYSAEGKESEDDFDYTTDQVKACIDKAADDPHIPYAVFKPTGVVRFGLLEKHQSGEQLNEQEQGEFDRAVNRFESICAHGVSKGVPVMIDSEESWIQGTVDQLVERLMFRFNQDGPMVFNTLQMYRHDRLDYLERFLRLAGEKQIFAAFKLVRGAYMEKERARAQNMGYPSPIYPNKEATDDAFNEATAMLIKKVNRSAVCVGSHNELSAAKAAGLMREMSLQPNHPHISFAQLLGMSDHISYNLAAAGYNVCKYVPYGPVNTVVPYLIRRAEENTSVAGQTSRELYLIRKEITRRKHLAAEPAEKTKA